MPESGKGPGKSYSSPAVEQAGEILFCLAGSSAPRMSLTEIAAQVGISGSKAFCILEALQKKGLVKRGESGKGYSLGAGLITLSGKVLNDLVPSRLAEPVLEQLVRDTGSTAVLGLITGENTYVAVTREAGGDIRVSMKVGHMLPLTYGAHGKAVVAFMPEGERERILEGDALYFYGSPGKLDRAWLEEELARCRQTGYAEDLGVTNQGVNVIAAPVIDASGHPIGYIEIIAISGAGAKVRAAGCAGGEGDFAAAGGGG